MATKKKTAKKLTQRQRILEASLLRRNIEQIESVAATALNSTFVSDGASGQIMMVPDDQLKQDAYSLARDSLKKAKKLTDKLVKISLDEVEAEPQKPGQQPAI